MPVLSETSVKCVPKQMAPVQRYRKRAVVTNSVNTACIEIQE